MLVLEINSEMLTKELKKNTPPSPYVKILEKLDLVKKISVLIAD